MSDERPNRYSSSIGNAQQGASPPPQDRATPSPGRGSAFSSGPVTDLSSDKLLRDAPRVIFNGHHLPSLGGIVILAKLGQGGMGLCTAASIRACAWK